MDYSTEFEFTPTGHIVSGGAMVTFNEVDHYRIVPAKPADLFGERDMSGTEIEGWATGTILVDGMGYGVAWRTAR